MYIDRTSISTTDRGIRSSGFASPLSRHSHPFTCSKKIIAPVLTRFSVHPEGRGSSIRSLTCAA